jgi:large subunit ribosomal protein L4
MKIEVKTFENKKVGDIELPQDIFGATVRSDILSRVIHWQLAKRRAGTHHSKNISEVSGTTKKPFKQKGTGKARQGSLRSPQMRGGGDVFGKRVTDHGYSLPKKVRLLGMKCALSSKYADKKLIVLDSFDQKSLKTKELNQKLQALGVSKPLFIDGSEVDVNLKAAAANLIGVDVLPFQGANVYDIMRHDYLVLSKSAIENLEKRLK